jgi:hypothetical protein
MTARLDRQKAEAAAEAAAAVAAEKRAKQVRARLAKEDELEGRLKPPAG